MATIELGRPNMTGLAPRSEAGVEREFSELYARYYDSVWAYLLRRTDPSTAEDLLAEVWTVAWRRFDQLPDKALPWLYGVARRVLANHHRSTRRRRALEERLAAEPTVSPSSTGETSIAQDEIVQAVSRLPDKYKEALRLVAWEELSTLDAAAAAGCSVTTFRVRLHRARQRLSRQLTTQSSATETADGLADREGSR